MTIHTQEFSGGSERPDAAPAFPAAQRETVNRAALRAAGLIGILAAVLVGAADIILLYSPQGGYGSGSYDYLGGISSARLLVGHTLGVLALPLEIAGLWQVSQALAKGARKTALAFLLIGAYSVILGAVYHAALAPIAALVQARDAAPQAAAALTALIPQTAAYSRSLAALMNYGVVAVSLLFAWAVGFRPTLYPRWMAFFNPLVIFFAVALAGGALPGVGAFILPAAFSLTNLIFFALSSALLWNPRPARTGA